MFKSMTANGDSKRSKKASLLAAFAIVSAAALGIVASPTSAQAVGMSTAAGKIQCTAVPAVFVGTSATAKGDVQFQLNNYNNTGQIALGTVKMGYSAAYTSWGWKYIASKAGNFYAYGYGANGNAMNAKKYCQG